jgi:hypothetical protein
MMLRKFSFFLFLVLLGCQRDDEGPQKNLKYAELKVISGNNQTGKTGEALANEIVLQVTPMNTKFKKDYFYLQQGEPDGNGYIQSSGPGLSTGAIFADETGTFKVTWKLGCVKKDLAITFYLYYSDSCRFQTPKPCAYVDLVTVKANAFTPHGWNKSCGLFYDTDRYKTKIRTYNNTMYVVNYGKLFKSKMGEGMYWEEMPGVPVNDIFDFGFTNTGRIYALTENHGVYTSDNFQNWTSTNTGILDPRYPISLLVEDSTVYVSFYFDGLYRLRSSKSNFWKKLLIDGKYYEQYKYITRHPNGNLYLVDKWDAYWVSANSGDAWTHIPIEYKYVNYETEDLKIHSSGNIYIGSGDASLAILNPDTYTGTLYRYYEWNASHQLINNILFRNSNDVYYLVNYTPNPGIYSSVNNWQKLDIGFDKPINQFVFDQNGNFILGTYNGLYYWKD